MASIRTWVEEYTDWVHREVHAGHHCGEANHHTCQPEAVANGCSPCPAESRLGNGVVLRSTRAELSRAFKKAKHQYTQKIQINISHTRDTRHKLQGIQALTDYKTT